MPKKDKVRCLYTNDADGREGVAFFGAQWIPSKKKPHPDAQLPLAVPPLFAHSVFV